MNKSKVSLFNLAYLVTSRRQQARVFGPPQIMLILGVAFALGAALDSSFNADPLVPLLVGLGVWAAYNGWRAVQRESTPLTLSLLVGGVALVLIPFALLADVAILLPWGIGLAIFGLGLTRA